MRISDWSSDVCSSDLRTSEKLLRVADPLIMIALSQVREQRLGDEGIIARALDLAEQIPACAAGIEGIQDDVALGLERHHRRRSEEHTSELQSLMRISYAVFCLTNNKPHIPPHPK